MRSTLEQRSSGWGRQALLVVLLAVLAVSVVRGSPAVGAAPDTPAVARAEACAPGQVAIAPTDVGVGDATRCLPVGGDAVQGSRVDPLYGQVAANLLERIPGRMAGVGGSVKVICWSKEDWNELTVAFRDAGEMEPLKYWLGWTRGTQRVINLSYPVCLHLDGIAYQNRQLALQAAGAAVGTLAHETMHISGIDDEGIADCYAMQLTSATASSLGAEPGYADLLRMMNFEFNEANRSGTEYDSPDCYDGGLLDLDSESRRWP